MIGIDEYLSPNWSNLNNAVRDAKDVAKLLIERYGFELLDEPLYNAQATRENVSQFFANAVTQLMEGDNLIIYFAGHGFMNPMTRKGFWVPHEADLKPTEMISNSEIKDFSVNYSCDNRLNIHAKKDGVFYKVLLFSLDSNKFKLFTKPVHINTFEMIENALH